MAIGLKSVNRPAPKWYRIADGIIGDAEDLVLTIMMLNGWAADAPSLLMYKIVSSFVRRQLKRFISNGEVYATEDTVSATLTQTVTATTVTPVPESPVAEKKDE